MEKIVIGYDYHSERRDKDLASKKAELLITAENFFKKYHLHTDRELLHKEGFKNYFLRLYSETYSKDFPSYMGAQERLNMANIDISPLAELDEKYKAIRCPFEPTSLSLPTIDYNFYLDTPEAIEKYKLSEELTKLLNRYAQKTGANYNSTLFRQILATTFKTIKINDSGSLEPLSDPYKYESLHY